MVSSPEMAAMRVIRGAEQKGGNWDSIDVPALMDQLRDQAEAVNRGDLAQAEGMLINQASALQAVFVRLSERAMEQTHMPNLESFMRMALRAQSQCRATLETLATIKNPPIVYAKQANFAAGHQQVNNGIPAHAQAREIESEQSQLSGVTNELLSDARASGIESRANPALETVGEVNRAKIGRG